ncbi:ribonuclease domain-containing protein [Streptomyces sp. NPDC047434]|uniref:ribonuclease domain-containing protein n=1 Tax=unclassified Streptomyces TaxID=2593676 RepID=UPI0033C520B4
MLLRPARGLLALLLCLGVLGGCSSAADGGASRSSATAERTPTLRATPPPQATPTTTRPPAPARSATVPGRVSGLPAVPVAELPAEARATLRLIERGGPFPYGRDGATFSDFERILPRRERGYYREYTVRTPGERDRGARRLVTGRGGEIYYTDDHYETFREVVPDDTR